MSATDTVKSMAGWNAAGCDLGKYLQVGDAVADDVMYYFLEVLPPACYRSDLVQIGEPNSHVNGKATYATVYKPVGARNWLFAGYCHRGQWSEAKDGAK